MGSYLDDNGDVYTNKIFPDSIGNMDKDNIER